MGAVSRIGGLLVSGLALAAPARAAEDAPPPTPPAVERPLADETGALAQDAFDALVEETEAARGLHFVRRPELVLLEPDAPERARLEADAKGLDPSVAGSAPPSKPAPGAPAPAYVDVDAARVYAAPPPAPVSIRMALARLIDAQNYPRLVELAPRLRGDAGLAVRSLLAASVSATSSNSWRRTPFEGPELDLLGRPRIEGRVNGIPQFGGQTAWLVAAVFLAQRDDREEPFRKPPLSTKQLLSPHAYTGSDRPVRLVGPPPLVSGCELTSDESLGVFAMLAALSAVGGSAPGPALASWQGDRLLRFRCADGAKPWIYVAELARADEAPGFVAALDALLPSDLVRPLGTTRSGRRAAAWSGLPGAAVRDYAEGLEAAPVRELEQLLP